VSIAASEAMAEVDREKVSRLLDLYDDIDQTLFSLQPEIEKIKSSQPVQLEEVLILAERLSYTAHAPMGWREGFPLLGKFPPAPQPDQMRLGKLAQYASPMTVLDATAKQKQTHEANENEFIDNLKQSLEEQIRKKSDLAKEEQRLREGMAPLPSLSRGSSTTLNKTRPVMKFTVEDSDESGTES
jgi:hypothetical protein